MPSAVDLSELYELLKDPRRWYLQSKHRVHMENDKSGDWGDSERTGMLLLKCYSSIKRASAREGDLLEVFEPLNIFHIK